MKNSNTPTEHIISTHTLTWSVTIVMNIASCTTGISTHTLTWSVTIVMNIASCTTGISTHTLTWSVTQDSGRIR